jgi:hypothetical protein
MPNINDNYLTNQQTSLAGLKNTMNQIVNGLAETSLYNLLSNPQLNHYFNGEVYPANWVMVADTGTLTIDNTGLYTTVYFNSGNINQYFYQDITTKLQPNTTYLLIVDVLAIHPCGFELTNSSGFINLNPNQSFDLSFTPTTDVPEYKNYMLFRTSNTISNITLKIKNLYNDNNNVTIKKLTLVKGSIELFDTIDKNFFLENLVYTHDPVYDVTGEYSWKITGDGVNYRPLAFAETPNSILTKLKTVDGTGSGLDADTLRGYSISDFLPATRASVDAEKLGGELPSYYSRVPLIRTQYINHSGAALSGVDDEITTTRASSLITGTFNIINGTNDVIGWEVTVTSNYSDGTNLVNYVIYNSSSQSVDYQVAFSPTFMYAPAKPGLHTFTIKLYGGNTTFFNPSTYSCGMFSILEF